MSSSSTPSILSSFTSSPTKESLKRKLSSVSPTSTRTTYKRVKDDALHTTLHFKEASYDHQDPIFQQFSVKTCYLSFYKLWMQGMDILNRYFRLGARRKLILSIIRANTKMLRYHWVLETWTSCRRKQLAFDRRAREDINTFQFVQDAIVSDFSFLTDEERTRWATQDRLFLVEWQKDIKEELLRALDPSLEPAKKE